MTTFASPIDNRPIIYGADSRPLTYGKVKFFDLGTSTARAVFTDPAFSTSAGVSVSLDITGRYANQYYLMPQGYTCKAYKFIGLDPFSVNPADWAFDHQWDSAGAIASVVSTGTVTAVASISDLALLDVSGPPSSAQVLGYYAANDCPVRTYQWVPGDLNAGNGGTIIKHTGLSAGSWIYQADSDVIDSRVFGILPQTPSDMSTKIQAMATAVNGSTSGPNTIYFSSGYYYVSDYVQTFAKPVIIDKGVTFHNVTSAGTGYFLNFTSSVTIKGNQIFRKTGSPGAVYPSFSNPGDSTLIDVRWFGAVLDGSTNDYTALKACVDHIGYGSYGIMIDGVLNLGTMSTDITLANDVYFRGAGKIKMSQTVKNLVFLDAIHNETCITGGSNTYPHSIIWTDGSNHFQNLAYFQFINTALRSSFFANDSANGSTYDLGEIIGGATVAQNTTFIFDMGTNLFDSASVSYATSERFGFVWEKGVLANNTPATPIHLANFDAPGLYCIATDGFWVWNTPTLYRWFLPVGGNAAAQDVAFVRGARCAVKSGQYDLCNVLINVANSAVITQGMSVEYCIRNGYISYSGTGAMLSISAQSFTSFEARDIRVISSTNCTVFGLASGTACTSVLCDNLKINLTHASSQFMQLDSGASVSDSITVRNSNILAGSTLINNLGTSEQLYLHNNRFQTNVHVLNMKSCVNGNTFFRKSLIIYDKAGLIDSVTSGNLFYSDATAYAKIVYGALTAGTVFSGASAVGNTFTGAYGSAQKMVDITGTYAATGHSLTLLNSSNEAGNLYCPNTSGSRQLRYWTTSGDNRVTFYAYRAPTTGLDASYFMAYIPSTTQFPNVLYMQHLMNNSVGIVGNFWSTDGYGLYAIISCAATQVLSTYDYSAATTWDVY